MTLEGHCPQTVGDTCSYAAARSGQPHYLSAFGLDRSPPTELGLTLRGDFPAATKVLGSLELAHRPPSECCEHKDAAVEPSPLRPAREPLVRANAVEVKHKAGHHGCGVQSAFGRQMIAVCLSLRQICPSGGNARPINLCVFPRTARARAMSQIAPITTLESPNCKT